MQARNLPRRLRLTARGAAQSGQGTLVSTGHSGSPDLLRLTVPSQCLSLKPVQARNALPQRFTLRSMGRPHTSPLSFFLLQVKSVASPWLVFTPDRFLAFLQSG